MISVQHNVLDKRTYSVEEIAAMLDISMTSAYRLIKRGHFNIVRIGTSIRISKVSFDTWLDSQEERND